MTIDNIPGSHVGVDGWSEDPRQRAFEEGIVAKVNMGEANTELIDEIYWTNPVLWVRCLIASENGLQVEDITDEEIRSRYVKQGLDWEHELAAVIRNYLEMDSLQ